MKIKLELGPDVDVKVETDEDGNPIGITLSPVFTKRNGQVVLAFVAATTDGGKQLDRFALTVSGVTGKVSKSDRTEIVKAAVDEEPKQQAAGKPADTPKKGE